MQTECKQANLGHPENIIESINLTKPVSFLKINVNEEAICTFSYSTDGSYFIPIGKEFRAVEGKWVGAKVGLFATTIPGRESRGYADFNFFNISDKNKS